MIRHIVMWKLKDSAEGASRRENAIKLKAGLENLKKAIKEIRLIEVGINTLESADAYDVVLVSEFDSLSDLQAYQKHPEHVNIADFIGKVRLERRVVDYEV